MAMMGSWTWRLSVAATILVALVGTASAERVVIETDPSGAELSIDDEPIGQAPYRGKLSPGSYTIVAELEGYETQFLVIEVRRRRRGRQRFSVELEELDSGFIEVSAGNSNAKGATIFVDEEELGKVPDRVPATVGAHSVEIVKSGFETFEEWVEVEGGSTYMLTVELGEDSGSDGEDLDLGLEKKKKPKGAAGPVSGVLINIWGGLHLEGRSFIYENRQTRNLRDYNAFPALAFRISVEAYPLARSPNPLLRGFGLDGTFMKAAPLNSVTTDERTLDTSFSDYDLGAHYLYRIGAHQVGAGGGFGGQNTDFSGEAELVSEVPGVSYRYLRASLEGRSIITPRVNAFARVDMKYITAIGVLADRFQETKANGIGGRLGALVSIKKNIGVRIEGQYTRYALKFLAAPAMEFVANGGTDHHFGATVAASYSY